MHPKSTSDQGINLIKKFEGLAKVDTEGMVVPYRCSANVLTIGYGHTKGVKKNMRITNEEAEVFLRLSVKAAEDAVKNLVTTPLTQNQFESLKSFNFNRCKDSFASSTLF